MSKNIIQNVMEVKTLVSVAPKNFKDEARKLDLPYYEHDNIFEDRASYTIAFSDIEALESSEGLAKELKLVSSAYRLDGYDEITLN
jgi:hypothetical protein